MSAVGCQSHAVPPGPAPPPEPPPCTPKLTTEIAQLKTVSEALPDGVTENDALDATVELVIAAGLTVDAQDRDAHTLVTSRFDGQTIVWACDLNEYRSYAYRVSIAGTQMIVGLDCWRSYGWDEHVVRGRVVPADHGVSLECLEPTKFTSRPDSMLTRKLIVETIELLRRRAGQ
jgi:hypothetical protein